MIHSLMARYLAKHGEELGIEKEGKGKRSGKGNPTVYGNETNEQGWKYNFWGVYYSEGNRIEQSHRKAVEWYRKAAGQGYKTLN